MENAALSPFPTKTSNDTAAHAFAGIPNALPVQKEPVQKDRARSRFAPQPVRRLRLNARDVELLEFLADNHLASRSQIQRLFYGSKAYCNYRLRALFDHEVVLRHFPSITGSGNWGEEAIYTLGPSAIEPLIQKTEEDAETLGRYLRRHRSPALISHSLHTVEIYLTFRQALSSTEPLMVEQLALERWVGEAGARHEYQRSAPGGWHEEVFKPDGFLRLQCAPQPRRFLSFFVECDLGHTSSAAWKTKIMTYRKYLESGLFQSTYGGKGFQTLVVTTGQKRIEHLLAATPESGIDFRFATWAQFRQNPLEAIWFSSAGDLPQRLACRVNQ